MEKKKFLMASQEKGLHVEEEQRHPLPFDKSKQWPIMFASSWAACRGTLDGCQRTISIVNVMWRHARKILREDRVAARAGEF
jgi:hypothetical protein